MSFRTSDFLNRASVLDLKSYNDNYIILDRLCKKIDVVKKIFTEYKDDLSKASSVDIISIDEYKKLITILLFYASKDLKYLNSTLKLFDIIEDKIDLDSKLKINMDIESILKGIE